MTICEIKYSKAPASRNIIKEFDQKVEHFLIPPRHSVERVLISAEGADESVRGIGYFDHITDLAMLAAH